MYIQATAQLNKEFYKNPSCISAMASIIANSPELAVSLDQTDMIDTVDKVTFQVRQLAAVEMRKRVASSSGEMWLQLPQNEREEIKNRLPSLILLEPKYVPKQFPPA